VSHHADYAAATTAAAGRTVGAAATMTISRYDGMAWPATTESRPNERIPIVNENHNRPQGAYLLLSFRVA
jgi:hypothetical protein